MTDLFQHFHGADIERLADCLVAIRVAGLHVDKHTQAGVNQSTGNVWVYSEDWAGCVFCSVGFDVQWLHSCHMCGEEYEFDTYEELVEYADKHHGQCEACIEEEVTA